MQDFSFETRLEIDMLWDEGVDPYRIAAKLDADPRDVIAYLNIYPAYRDPIKIRRWMEWMEEGLPDG